MRVNIVSKWFNSPWPEDVHPEIVKVFPGTYLKTALKWARDQEKECKREYIFNVDVWGVVKK